jgi:hypothetical protein
LFFPVPGLFCSVIVIPANAGIQAFSQWRITAKPTFNNFFLWKNQAHNAYRLKTGTPQEKRALF